MVVASESPMDGGLSSDSYELRYYAPQPRRPSFQPSGSHHANYAQQLQNNEAPSLSAPTLLSQSTGTVINPQIMGEIRDINRTPSPTPSEIKALSDERSWFQKSRQLRFWKSKEGLTLIAVVVITVGIIVGASLGLTRLAKVIDPRRHRLRNVKGGFLLPVGLLIIVSFPPLIGHELIAPLCSMVYGLWVGFAIVCAGTLLGEAANFVVFRFAFRERVRRWQISNIRYGTIAEATRQGGFKVMLGARFSFIPPHIITPIFATSGVKFLSFIAAAALALPRQFVIVYTGTFLDETARGNVPSSEKLKTTLIQAAVGLVTIAVTIFAGRYMERKMKVVRPQVVYSRRKARQSQPDMFSKKKGHNISGSREYLTGSQQSAV